MSATAIAYNRFGLGARADDKARITDPRAWLVGQIGRFDPRPPAIAALPGSAALAGEVAALLDAVRRVGKDDAAAKDARRSARGLARDGYAAQVRARVETALLTPTPFAERLAHFWANHFAVSADKLTVLGLVGALEFEAIRPHVFGRFADMLLAVERHPAMLLYLDQAQSVGPASRVGRMAAERQSRRPVGLNENLGREILELHTLGVGNYSQADVTELARALTGWTVAGLGRRRLGVPGAAGRYAFFAPIHEPGGRRLLGKAYPESGAAQAEAMLADLAVHPATARHIAVKLARHFVADEPPPALVERLTRVFVESDGDLAALSRALVDAPEAWQQPLAKFKSPWDWSLSALRGVGARQADPMIAGVVAELGQPVWRPGSPAGWDDRSAAWAGPDALIRRVEVAQRIAQRSGGLDARALGDVLLPGILSTATRTAIGRAGSPAEGLALLLVSPEFLRR
jgi:uncharacterized protein (DUF1800 family)